MNELNKLKVEVISEEVFPSYPLDLWQKISWGINTGNSFFYFMSWPLTFSKKLSHFFYKNILSPSSSPCSSVLFRQERVKCSSIPQSKQFMISNSVKTMLLNQLQSLNYDHQCYLWKPWKPAYAKEPIVFREMNCPSSDSASFLMNAKQWEEEWKCLEWLHLFWPHH